MKPNAPRVSKFYVVLFAAFIGMGMSMPSCPGQQAMQQQIDQLTTQNSDLTRRIQALNTEVNGLNKDMSDVKNLLKPMADAVQAQKAAMDQLDANLKEVQAKMAAAAKARSTARVKSHARKPISRKHH